MTGKHVKSLLVGGDPPESRITLDRPAVAEDHPSCRSEEHHSCADSQGFVAYKGMELANTEVEFYFLSSVSRDALCTMSKGNISECRNCLWLITLQGRANTEQATLNYKQWALPM